MRLTILWTRLASYTYALFKQLTEQEGWEIQLIYKKPSKDAPYDPWDLSFCTEYVDRDTLSSKALKKKIQSFSPDVILMTSWSFPDYRRIARINRGRACYVFASMDNQWRGTVKQRIGTLISPWYLQYAIDNFFVTGERQAQFAHKLGYPRPLYGFYAANTSKTHVTPRMKNRLQAFLFCGRLVSTKGVHVLLDAYTMYRKLTREPWPLIIAGTGPLEPDLTGVPGVDYRGFVQPENLSSVFEEASCFVLPSLFEPWGVVIHEAAAAGLPIIASHRAGATTRFVQEWTNGYIVPPARQELCEAMCKMASLPSGKLQAMSENSRKLGEMWTPAIAAEYFTREATRSICKYESCTQ